MPLSAPAPTPATSPSPDLAPGTLRCDILSGAPEIEAEAEAEGDEALQRLLHLNEIGLALSSERDIDRLLSLILSKARELSNADAGSLYILESPEERADHRAHHHASPSTSGASGERVLYFRLSQNESVALPSASQKFPVGASTLAGYAAATGQMVRCDDAYAIPDDAPYSFTPRWDRDNGYRTRSVLVVPMKNRDGEVMGVLQLINRKILDAPLRTPEDFERNVIPFDDDLARLSEVVASHAAVAFETNHLLSEVTRLLADIETTFDSFVRAAAQLIDDRDPPTAGHSQRVTRMTITLAMAACEEEEGRFEAFCCSTREAQELRYAGLLHDVGKIGVRESIFSKSHKLEPALFEGVLHRIARLRAERELKVRAEILHAWKSLPREDAEREEARLEQALWNEMSALEIDRALLIRANDPTIRWLSDGEFHLQQAAIARLSKQSFESETGPQVLVEAEEAVALSVRRGSLTAGERAAMEEHAQMSFEFLEQIAWPRHLSRIPEIAHLHHEKLDGSGYPRGLKAEEISLLARMLTVADIFDALTAADRPYKRAMPVEKALAILNEEAAQGKLDADVVELFARRRVWEAAQEVPAL